MRFTHPGNDRIELAISGGRVRSKWGVGSPLCERSAHVKCGPAPRRRYDGRSEADERGTVHEHRDRPEARRVGGRRARGPAAAAAANTGGRCRAPSSTRRRALGKRQALADSTKASLTYADTFLRAVVLGRVLKRLLGPEKYVGLLVPPTVPTAVANLALALLGKVPVNLNYTASQALVDSSIDQCGITHVLTSKKVLDKFGITPKGTLIFLEDIPAQVRKADKLFGAAVAKLVPIPALGAFLPGLKDDRLDATATVIFTSGSTGDPKGVVLSHRNVLSNVHQFDQHLRLLPDEALLGILPFFHSFGFTVTIWTVLCLGRRIVYHFNPLDARIIGDLCEKHGVTMIVATPTFIRTYLKKCEPSKFKTLVHLLLGAEKLKPELCEEIRETLGLDPLEGYGCTELSPVVAVNVLHELTRPDGRKVPGNRLGTVGMPLPGTAVKTVDPETGADLPRGRDRPDPGQGAAGHGRLPEPARGDREGHQGRLVQHRRPRLPRRGRVPADHRPAEPVLEDRRRDGAAHGGRVGDPRRARDGRAGAWP